MTEPQQEVFGGVPAWLLVEYLASLGGSAVSDGQFEGEGWSATVEPQPRPEGSHAIGRVTVTIEGTRSAEIMAELREKAQRGGG
ncbi:MAG TPA: DUF1952 domain-containing protein [Dehalococcoidia bacterium]|nr:DUF1952 domain-containing protein [Dehalococcoidia bacterium]